MIRENGRWASDPNSAMNLVQSCLAAGMQDRKLIAEQTGLSRAQVGYAVRNLQAKGRIEAVKPSGSAGKGKGRTPAVYAPVTHKGKSQFAGISSIFDMGAR
jgi:predicted ArsR family transcriptional regulator